MFFVKIVSGKFSKVIDDNLPCDTILDLKHSINRRHGIPLNLLNLSYGGVFLEDAKRISGYGIQSQDSIDLELKLLEINFFKSGTYQLKWYVENGVTVAELAKRILGIIPGIIFGIHDNYVLKDSDTIMLA